MSDEVEVMMAEEAEIRELHAEVAEGLDALRENVCEVARKGAAMGQHIAGWKKHAHVRTDEEFWNKLRKLDATIREDVVRFALRSLQAQRKCALLDDASQLTFALALPGEDAAAERGVPQRRESNELLLLANACQRTLGFIREWQEREPMAKWPASVRQSVRETLEPLVKLYAEVAA